MEKDFWTVDHRRHAVRHFGALVASLIASALLRTTAMGDQVAAPVLEPNGGASEIQLMVKISCATSGAVIHYSMSGVDPVLADPVVASGGTVYIGRSTMLKAKAWGAGASAAFLPSDVASAAFSVVGGIAAGDLTSFVEKFDGSLFGTGKNADGRLGDGSLTSKSSFSLIGGGHLQIASGKEDSIGQSHTVDLRADGTVWCAGANGYGQLGNHSTVALTSHTFAQVSDSAQTPISGIVSVAAGAGCSFALRSDGSVYAWGANGAYHSLGDGGSDDRSYAGFVMVDAGTALTDVIEIAAGAHHVLALKSDGSLWAWGNNAHGQLGNGTQTSAQFAIPVSAGSSNPGNPGSAIAGVASIGAGAWHSLAVMTDGTVLAWGETALGRLGDGNTNATLGSITLPGNVLGDATTYLDGISTVAGGESFSLFLKTDGTVWAVGHNASGEIGDGGTTASGYPHRVQTGAATYLAGIIAIAAGKNHGLALDGNGALFTWGGGASGQLGNGSTNGNALFAAAPPGSPLLVNSPPTLTLTVSPLAAEVPGTFILTASPADLDGNLTGVDFYRGATFLGRKTGAPWVWPVPNMPLGVYNFGALAFDATGAQSPLAVVAASAVLPSVSVSASSPTVAEGDTVNLTFARSAGAQTDQALQVTYTVNGTAAAGSDYVGLSGSATIPAGQSSASVPLVTLSDSAYDPSETVVVTVATTPGMSTAGTPSQATVTLADKVPGPTTNLTLWLRADAAITTDSSGNVSTWADVSGHAHDATQGTASSRPQLLSAALNGMPGLKFDGTTFLTIPSTLPSFVTGVTAFVIGKPTAVANWGRYFDFGTGQSANNLFLCREGTTNNLYWWAITPSGNATARGTGLLPLNQYQLAEVTENSTIIQLFVNGALATSSTGAAPANVALTSNFIGKSNWATDALFQGEIAEVIVYNRALTIPERQQVENYLNQKYRLVSASPPLSPNALTAASGQILVSWLPGAGAETYTVERKGPSDSTFSAVSSLSNSMTSYLDRELEPGSAYTYRIAAVKMGVSAYSDETTANAGSIVPGFPADGLQVWVRSDAGVGLDGSGNVFAWADLSGSGNYAIQSTVAARPILASSAVNGMPSLRFDGARFLSIPTSLPSFAPGVTAFAVAKPTAVASWGRYFDFGSGQGINNLFLGREGTTDNLYWWAFTPSGNATARGTGLLPLNQYQLAEVTENAAAIKLFVNGTLATTSAGAAPANVALASNYIGKSNWSGDPNFQGEIAELIVYNRVLTDSERQQVENYLNRRYQLVAAVAPQDVLAQGALTGQIVVTWSTVPSATSYRVERKGASDADFVNVASLSDKATAYVDQGLVPGAAYSYRVVSGKMGLEAASTPVSATAGSAPIVPSTDGLITWLRADTGVALDGSGNVSTWADLSGTGHHATQSTAAARPHLNANALNGAPGLAFDGTASFLSIPSALGAFGGGVTMMVVAKPTAVVNYARILDFGNGQGVNNLILCRKGTTNTVNWIAIAPAGSVTLDGTDLLTLSQYKLFAGAQNATTAQLFVNGTLTASGLGMAPAAVPLSSNLIGKSNWAGDPFFQGEIAEILVYDRVLSPTERRTIEIYVNQRYHLVTPDPLQGLFADAVSSERINLAWSGAATASSFRIERRADNATEFTTLGTVAGRTRTYADVGLSAVSAYTYRVYATSLGVESDQFAEAAATTLPIPTGFPTPKVIAWFSAGSGVTKDSNGAVSALADLSGNNHDATQVTAANQPTWVASALGGSPAIRFNGTSSLMPMSGNLGNFAQGLAIFVVAQSNRTDSAAEELLSLTGSSYQELHLYRGSSDYALRYRYRSGEYVSGEVVALKEEVPGVPRIWEATHVGTTARLLRNGIEVSAAPMTTLSATDLTGNTLGAGGMGSPFSGDIAEVLILKGALSMTERRSVESYLASKYHLATATSLAPDNFQAQALSSMDVALTWYNPPSGSAVDYIIQRKTLGGVFVQVGTVTNGGSMIDHVAPATAYTYRVQAAGLGAPASAWSDELTVTTPTSTVAPVPQNGLRLWLSSDALTENAVSTWIDLSGSGNHATQTTASAQPLVVKGAANGLPVVRFNGSSSLVLPTGMLDYPGLNGEFAGEVLTVHRTIRDPNQVVPSGFHMLGSDGHGLYTQTNGVVTDSFGSTVPRVFDPLEYSLDQFHLYDAVSSTNYWAARIAGLDVFHTSTNTVAFEHHPQLGVSRDANFRGDIAEILIYDRELTGAERAAAQLYLTMKYGIGSAPSDVATLTATPINGQVRLRWDYSSDDPTVNFTIERRGSGGGYAQVATVGDVRLWFDNDADPGVTYSYRLRAIKATGVSSLSNEATASTPPVRTGVWQPVELRVSAGRAGHQFAITIAGQLTGDSTVAGLMEAGDPATPDCYTKLSAMVDRTQLASTSLLDTTTGDRLSLSQIGLVATTIDLRSEVWSDSMGNSNTRQYLLIPASRRAHSLAFVTSQGDWFSGAPSDFTGTILTSVGNTQPSAFAQLLVQSGAASFSLVDLSTSEKSVENQADLVPFPWSGNGVTVPTQNVTILVPASEAGHQFTITVGGVTQSFTAQAILLGTQWLTGFVAAVPMNSTYTVASVAGDFTFTGATGIGTTSSFDLQQSFDSPYQPPPGSISDVDGTIIQLKVYTPIP